MKDKLMKMMAKKKESGDMSEPEKKAKMSVLEELQKMATEAMAGRLHGMKKVEVASNSKEGLEKGLDKAKHMIMPDEEHMEEDTNPDHGHEDLMPETEEDEGSSEHEAEESPADEEAEHEDMSEEDIDAKLEKLMALKRRKGMK